jgi:hypothetical protein
MVLLLVVALVHPGAHEVGEVLVDQLEIPLEILEIPLLPLEADSQRPVNKLTLTIHNLVMTRNKLDNEELRLLLHLIHLLKVKTMT